MGGLINGQINLLVLGLGSHGVLTLMDGWISGPHVLHKFLHEHEGLTASNIAWPMPCEKVPARLGVPQPCGWATRVRGRIPNPTCSTLSTGAEHRLLPPCSLGGEEEP
eukprot:jgi/Mesvir1/28641/Mv25525-RA.1